MSSTLSFKEISLNSIPSDELNNYMINEEKQTAIKIPSKVDKILPKFRDSTAPQSILSSDVLTIALAYKKHDYKASRKLVHSTLTSELLNGYFTNEEVSTLLKFLFEIPNDYRFNYHAIWSHAEMPVITT